MRVYANKSADVVDAPVASAPVRDARVAALLHGPLAATLARLAWPNTLMMVAQSATGLVETWFLARLGTDVLAGVAVVVPVLMLMQNMSQGAMGGGISGAVARALGAGRVDDAGSIARHALVLNAVLGLLFTVLLLFAGPALYHRLGAEGAALAAARSYGGLVFAGIALAWVMNAFASVIRGTGNMLVPGLVICGGALALIPLSPCLIFGLGPLPALGVRGGALALLLYYAVGALVLGLYCASPRCAARLRAGPLHGQPLREILRVGALACLNPLLTNGLLAGAAALVSAFAGTAALAGYATGARLEYVVIPIAFGLGAPMVAMVGANLGAGQHERARRAALAGGAMAFVLAEMLGLAAAAWPDAWLGLFGHDPALLAAGRTYLRLTGPCYGFFALGFSLYFASQGAGRLAWPLWAVALRAAVVVGAGAAVLRATGSLAAFVATGAAGMVAYGAVVAWSVWAGTWFRPRR